MLAGMREEMKVLYIHPPEDHPAHIDFANTINADSLSYPTPRNLMDVLKGLMNGIRIPDYDVYVVTGVEQALAKKVFSKKKKIIYLIADEYFVGLTSGIPFKTPRWKRFLVEHLSGFVDGGIAISEFVKREASKILNCRIEVIYPHIPDNLYTALRNLNPDLEAHNIVSVGRHHPVNGMDILVEAFRIVKKEYTDAELYIIGRGHPKEWEKCDGIHVLGYVDDFSPFFQKSSLFALVGRGQGFCTAAVEAMYAGLPAMVSEYTGAKEVVSELGKQFITTLEPEDVANKIMHYFNLSYEERRKISKKARGLSAEFNKEKKCKEFKQKFEKMLEEIK